MRIGGRSINNLHFTKDIDLIAGSMKELAELTEQLDKSVEINRYNGLADISADIWVLPIYRYRPIYTDTLVGVDKMLLYSSRIQTICARKNNEASQDNYLTATLAGAVS